MSGKDTLLLAFLIYSEAGAKVNGLGIGNCALSDRPQIRAHLCAAELCGRFRVSGLQIRHFIVGRLLSTGGY
jgi:hypothetical protein